MLIFTKFRFISAINSNDNRMLFVCDIFNINLCEILNKNQFLCPKIHYYSLCIIQLFGINIEILYNISSSMPFRGNF